MAMSASKQTPGARHGDLKVVHGIDGEPVTGLPSDEGTYAR